MAKRREANVFSLSFLDIMSCGFGAVILIFIVINHASETTTQSVSAELMAEIKKVEELITDEQEHLITLRNSVKETDDEIVTTQDMAIQVAETIQQLETLLAELQDSGASQSESIEQLKSELKELELEAANLEGAVDAGEDSGNSLRTIAGAGDRQYLTGLKIGGQHILILLDTSGSMLDNKIVNIFRRRNMPEAAQIASPKWQRAIKTVEWITANMPKEANFQLFTFNDTAEPAIEGTADSWLRAIEREDQDAVINHLKETAPSGGTSLHAAFARAGQMEPLPDNIYLIIDSLPTRGLEPPRGGNVDGRERARLFSDALDLLPQAAPVNVILFPMEGDPIATPSYWRLAQVTGGSFLSPPEDWP